MHGWSKFAHDAVKINHGSTSSSAAADREEWMERMLAQRGCRNATHAEANALAFAARAGISTDGATLYASVSPCEGCARLLIAAGIRRVVFLTPYRDLSGIALLQEAGVSV